MERQRIEQLYAAHHPGAVRLAYLLTGDAALAEDLAQEAFLKAMTGGFGGMTSAPAREDDAKDEDQEDLDDIRKQLSELQDKLSKMNK